MDIWIIVAAISIVLISVVTVAACAASPRPSRSRACFDDDLDGPGRLVLAPTPSKGLLMDGWRYRYTRRPSRLSMNDQD